MPSRFEFIQLRGSGEVWLAAFALHVTISWIICCAAFAVAVFTLPLSPEDDAVSLLYIFTLCKLQLLAWFCLSFLALFLETTACIFWRTACFLSARLGFGQDEDWEMYTPLIIRSCQVVGFGIMCLSRLYGGGGDEESDDL